MTQISRLQISTAVSSAPRIPLVLLKTQFVMQIGLNTLISITADQTRPMGEGLLAQAKKQQQKKKKPVSTYFLFLSFLIHSSFAE